MARFVLRERKLWGGEDFEDTRTNVSVILLSARPFDFTLSLWDFVI